MKRAFGSIVAGIGILSMAMAPHSGASPAIRAKTPIQHIVIIDQENHSFDNVLGPLCVQDQRCNGAVMGRWPDGSLRPLQQAADLVPSVDHSVAAQRLAYAGGAMDGFTEIGHCVRLSHPCMTQFQPSQIPNLAALARTFAISDSTFQSDPFASWGSHLSLAASTLDGFSGDNPAVTNHIGGRGGWGCDSNKSMSWTDPVTGVQSEQPSCVPDYNLDPRVYPFGGAYAPTPVPHVDTIMDRLDAARRSWRIYQGYGPGHQGHGGSGYGWAICPTFADCRYTAQAANKVAADQVISDAQAGTLPAVSFVIPVGPDSQHNGNSMLVGDNWIGRVVNAIENGPAWSSTAVFITYDDCGCFYDHVAPPPGLGFRMPMVIVSPYVKAGYTDSKVATFASMLAFIERNFHLAPLGASDASAYDYAHAFDFSQAPLSPIRMVVSPVPASELAWITAHPDRSET